MPDMSPRPRSPRKHELEGVSTVDARHIIITVSKSQEYPRFPQLRTLCIKELGKPLSISLTSSAIALIIAFFLSPSSYGTFTFFVEAVLILLGVFLNVTLFAVLTRCRHTELYQRWETISQTYEKNAKKSIENGDDDISADVTMDGLKQGSAVVSIISAYRDGKWQRIPKLLLVEGDIIALMAGDLAPGNAELLTLDREIETSTCATLKEHMKNPKKRSCVVEAENTTFPAHAGSLPIQTKLSSGEKVQLRPEARAPCRYHSLVPAMSPLLLLLCGDTRCYRLLETPLVEHLHTTFRQSTTEDDPPKSLLTRRVQALLARMTKMTYFSVFFAVLVGVLRISFSSGAREMWPLYVLVVPANIAVCLLPFTFPLYAFVGESLCTARILSFFELLLAHKSSPASERLRLGKCKDSSPSLGSRLGQVPKPSYQSTGNEDQHVLRSDSSFLSGSDRERGKSGDFDEFDIEERQELTSGDLPVVSLHRFFAYFISTIRARFYCGLTFKRGSLLPAHAWCRLRENSTWISTRRLCSRFFTRISLFEYKHFRCFQCIRRLLYRIKNSEFQSGLEEQSDPVYSSDHRTDSLLRNAQLLPIPLLSCAMLERLGAASMLCMLDEDTVCQPHAAVQELFVLDNKEEGNTGTVLDLHTMASEKGVHFEDTQWWTHLSTLKPIGLTCLLAETSEHNGRGHKAGFTGLNEKCEAIHVDQLGSSRHKKAHARRTPSTALLEHVRRTIPMEHLRDLSKEIGFSNFDQAMYREKRRIHVINPKLAASRATESAHAQGHEETRRRGTIQPHVKSVVVEDKRTRALQLLSLGNPSLLLTMCSEYWEGTAISSIPPSLRSAILDMYQQWSLEDLDVVAFAYSPVSYTAQPFLSATKYHPDYLVYSSHVKSRAKANSLRVVSQRKKTQSIFKGLISETQLDVSIDSKELKIQDSPTRQRSTSWDGPSNEMIYSKQDTLTSHEDQQLNFTPELVVSPYSVQFDDSLKKEDPVGQIPLNETDGLNLESNFQRSQSQRRHSISAHYNAEQSCASTGRRCTDKGNDIFTKVRKKDQKQFILASEDKTTADALWRLMHEQVFLGMVASSVPPKKGMSSLIEDMMASGVRFVYFSPRNMRRSKAIAEDMGIETDWNCAISLRPLDQPNTPDPHRMTSTYADWDVMARLPHGISAIREHIEKVDNVPLLVNLFTDATKQTTLEMIRVFQEYGETVLCIGSCYRAANAKIFRSADLSLFDQTLPMNQPISSLPFSSPNQLSSIDIDFNSNIIGLYSTLPLGSMSELDDGQSIIVDLIREGRKLLLNSYQALSFALWSACTLALFVLLSSALPIAVPPTPGGLDIIWLVSFVLPMLSLPLLAAPPFSGLMRRSFPEKNVSNSISVSLKSRHASYIMARALPTVFGCILLYIFTFRDFLLKQDPVLASSCASSSTPTLSQLHWCDKIANYQDIASVKIASGTAFDLCMLEFVLVSIVQSFGFMHRIAPITQQKHQRCAVLIVCSLLAFIMQVLYMLISSAVRESTSLILSTPWEVLVAGLVWPLFILVACETVIKTHDAKLHGRYMTFLRLEFNTRLGMHSPR